MQASQDRIPDRVKSAIGVVVFHALLGYALVTGLGFEPAAIRSAGLKLFDVPVPPPPPPVEETRPSEAEEGAAAPPNLEARPVPVVTPPPEVRLEVPPPIVAAPVPATGNQPRSGASDRIGPGTGAGGEGFGTGSGGTGTGSGSGIATRARLIRGRLRDSDYPRSARRGTWESVSVRFTVAPNGRAAGCTVTKSSGNRSVDAAACRLIERRFRYEPARDARGRPVPDLMVGTDIWRT
jgi:periplasmic protein TonB